MTVKVASDVGSESGVSVTRGVFVTAGVAVEVAVGGNGVAVGMAACVCATTVNAAAIAVFCTSTALMVGTAGAALQALAKTVIKRMSESG